MTDVKGIDAENVTRWFRDNVEGVESPLAFELIAGGHSNLTFSVTDASGRKFVLRRPPLGHVLESAHDMGREHKIVSALGPTDVPVAPVFGLCEDASVNGASFYVMGFVEGPVLHDETSARALPEPERRSIGLDVADVLARLHAVDPDAVGLGDLGRKEAYVARQLRRWKKQWDASKTREIPEMDEAHRRLEDGIPEQKGATIVHGDYRLGNFIVRHGKLAAVLDWELCTLGDPLADVGYLLNNWVEPGEGGGTIRGMSPTAAGAFPSRKELVELYESATGRDLSGIAYYRAFASWRLAAINEGVYARYIHGAMGTPRGIDLEAFAASTEFLACEAIRQLDTL